MIRLATKSYKKNHFQSSIHFGGNNRDYAVVSVIDPIKLTTLVVGEKTVRI